MKDYGTLFIAGGIVLIIVGITLNLGIIPWGRLPGDIRIVRPGFSFSFPLVTCLLVSLAASLILMLLRFFR
jgi:hypothetical protein